MWQPRIFDLALLAILVLGIAQELRPAQAAEMKCLKCDSESDINCIKDLSKFTPETCTGFCTTAVDPATGKVTRGCETDDAKCAAPNCIKCTTPDGCNKHNVCKTCDSSKDADCSQTDGSKSTYNTICAAADTQCLTNVKADKHLERKCATADEVKACTNPETCNVCSGANCNVKVFPTNRLRCYQCPSTDTKCGNVAANTDSIVAKYCLLYAADEKCYTFGTGATSMTRGCVSDTNTDVNKCSTPGSNEACATCNADNCNDSNFERNQKLKCVQCTSSKEDNKCQWGQETTSAKDCQKPIAYNKPDQCYTQTKDSTVYRGCFYDRETTLGDCKAETSCETCTNGDGCNNKDTGVFSCIICRSDLEPKCLKKATELKGSTCRTTITQEVAECYYGTWNGVAIRGCLADGDVQQQAVCKDEKNKQCQTCKEQDCNTKELNGAAAMTVTTGLVAVVLFALWRLY